MSSAIDIFTALYNMALPPEQINIKRRREEEPVETLCTDFPPFALVLPHNLDPSNSIFNVCIHSFFGCIGVYDVLSP